MLTVTRTGNIVTLLPLAGAVVLLALAFASPAPLVFLAVVGLAVGTAVVLRAPVWVLLASVVSGPTLGGWLDFSAGGAFPAATVDRALLLAVVAYAGFMVLNRRMKLLPTGRIELAMVVFIVVAATSLAVRGGSLPDAGESGLRLDVVFLVQSYLMPFMFFSLAKNLVRERYLGWVLGLYVAVGIFVGLVAILQFFTDITWFTPSRYKVIHEGRAVGTLHSAPHFGVVMSVSLISAFAILAGSRGGPARKMAAGGLAIMVAALALSKTRAVYLGMLAAIAAMGIMIPRTRRAILAATLLGLAVLIAIWPVVSQSSFVRGRLMDPVPVYNRIALWGTAANMVIHKPVTGFGFGQRTFREERADYFVRVGDVPPDYAFSLGATHNEYFNVLVMTGLLGFVPFAAILVMCWRRGMLSYRRTDANRSWEHWIAFVAVASLATYLANGLFGDLSACWYGSNMIFFLFGILEGCAARRAAGGAAAGPPGITRARV